MTSLDTLWKHTIPHNVVLLYSKVIFAVLNRGKVIDADNLRIVKEMIRFKELLKKSKVKILMKEKYWTKLKWKLDCIVGY